MEAINRAPLVDILGNILGKTVVMDGDRYVTMVGNEAITEAVVADALVKQEELYQEMLLVKVKAEAEAVLNATGWIIEKYTDLVAIQQVMTNEEFNAKYADVLAKRNEARELL